MKKILIVDDDVHIGNVVQELLEKEGYSVLRAYSGTEALLLLSAQTPDLILLDLMLPGITGEEVLPQIKDKGIPILVVSAKSDIDNKVGLLRSGAADYLTKPFDSRELLARIAIQLRQKEQTTSCVMRFADITLYTDTRLVTVAETKVKLTRTEYAILKILMANQYQVVTKSLLLDLISTDTPDCTDSSLKIHISNLRKKLREVTGKDYIEAVWGIGFLLHAE